MTTEVSFYCNQLIVMDEAVTSKHVQDLIQKPYTSQNSNHFETMDCVIEGDFVKLKFQTGDPVPWNPEVYDIKINQNIDNRREKTQVEPTLYFGLIDLRKSWVWLPYRAKSIFKEAVKSIHKNFLIKPILDEKEFFERIKELDEVKFGVAPENLFGNQHQLAKTLTEDIYAYGADYAELVLKYKNTRVSDSILKLIKSNLNQKVAYSKIVVAGRDINGLDLLFNTEAISTKIKIDVPTDDNGMIVEDYLYNLLINRITNEN